MGKTWSKRHEPKKPRKPKGRKAGKAVLMLLMALALSTTSWAGQNPKPGDMALGGSISSTNALPDETCKSVPGPSHCGHPGSPVQQCDTDYPMASQFGVSFEMWADEYHSYQAGLSLSTDDYKPSAYSATAWHLPYAKGAGAFASAGLAAANGTGILADAGAGLEFFPGKMAVQLRADYFYAFSHPDEGADRGSLGFGLGVRKKW